jgi:uncharacterized small protein (DUF1192 family)
MEFTTTILTAVQTINDARVATDEMATAAVTMIDARVTTLNEELAILTAARAELVTGMTTTAPADTTDSTEAPVKSPKSTKAPKSAPKSPKSDKRMSESDRRKARLAAARAAKAQANGDADNAVTDNVVEFPTNGTRKSQIQSLLASGMSAREVSDKLDAHISYVYTCKRGMTA